MEEVLTGKEDPSLFRVMQQQMEGTPTIESVRVTGPSERTAEELVQIEPSFSEHESVTGQPFTASYLKLDKVYKQLDMPDQLNVKRIEAYVTDQMTLRHLQDTPKAALSILKEIEDKLHINADHDPFYRAERLSGYIQALTTYKEKDAYRQSLVGQRSRNEKGQWR